MPDELIEEAQRLVRNSSVSVPEHAAMIDRLTAHAASLQAERDGLAAIIEGALHAAGCDLFQRGTANENLGFPCNCWKSQSPADALAGVKAEAAATALEEAISAITEQRDHSHHDGQEGESHAYHAHGDGRFLGKTVALRWLRARAAAIRSEVK